MASELIEVFGSGTSLTKDCPAETLRAYFQHVLILYKGGEAYPVNLDDVWMLVYSAKNKATRALRRDFIEGEDFITVTIPGQGGQFGRTDYKLSTACFEYFIARKVREVFEVYRTVFKKVATGEVRVAPKTQAEMLLMYAQQLVENEQRVAALENKQQEIEEKVGEIAKRTKTEVQYSTIVGFAKRFGIDLPLQKAATLGTVSKNLCRQYQLEMGTFPDPRFGSVRTYPDSVLYDTFEKYYPNVRFR